MHRLFVSLCLSIVLFGGCAAPQRPLFAPRKPKAKATQVYLVSNGFHTSLAIRAQDAPSELRAFDGKARYFVIGWGGRDFYMGRTRWPWDYFTSLLLPNPSALHVIPIRTSLVRECARSEIIEFDVDPAKVAKLRKRISTGFRRNPFGEPHIVGPGKLPNSRFFSGTETYVLPKTCNLWVASHLRTAGVPMTVCAAIAADNIIWQGRKYGRVLSRKRYPSDTL
jgi:uncharacterized protein (TIGR02117 family)